MTLTDYLFNSSLQHVESTTILILARVDKIAHHIKSQQASAAAASASSASLKASTASSLPILSHASLTDPPSWRMTYLDRF